MAPFQGTFEYLPKLYCCCLGFSISFKKKRVPWQGYDADILHPVSVVTTWGESEERKSAQEMAELEKHRVTFLDIEKVRLWHG